jgi:hypothetical protein
VRLQCQAQQRRNELLDPRRLRVATGQGSRLPCEPPFCSNGCCWRCTIGVLATGWFGGIIGGCWSCGCYWCWSHGCRLVKYIAFLELSVLELLVVGRNITFRHLRLEESRFWQPTTQGDYERKTAPMAYYNIVWGPTMSLYEIERQYPDEKGPWRR